MADYNTKKQRSYNMSRIKSSKTKPELILKDALRGRYLRYQPKIYGKPDFASKKNKTVIFVDGCFWHKCPKCYREPKTNKDFWLPKIERNVERDKKVTKKLKSEGWDVIRIWEHEIKKNPKTCVEKIVGKNGSRKNII